MVASIVAPIVAPIVARSSPERAGTPTGATVDFRRDFAMPLKPCPHCARPVPHLATQCPGCGRQLGLRGEAPPPVPAASSTTALADAPPVAPPRAEPPFALCPVAVHKLVALSLCTIGFYNLFWMYRSWARLRDRRNEDVSPFWRTFFAGFTTFGLFGRVADEAYRVRMPVAWSSGLLGALHFALAAAWRLPQPWSLLGLFAFAPIVPVVRTVNELNRRRAVPDDANARFSAANVVTLMLGGLFTLLVIVGNLAGDG